MYIPYKKLTIISALPQQEVIDRISLSIQKPSLNIFSYPPSEPPFIGKTNGDKFSVYRAIHYKNSFLPRIKGKVLPKGNQTEVDIRMTLHPFITAFMCVWMGGIAFFIILVSMFYLTDQLSENLTVALAMPLGMMAFGYFLMTVPFQIEAKKAEAIIKTIIT